MRLTPTRLTMSMPERAAWTDGRPGHVCRDRWSLSRLVLDPTRSILYPGLLAATPSQIFFLADSKLWVSDGTQEGTRSLGSIRGIHSTAVVGESIFFQGYDNDQRGMWTSDGTSSGTMLVDDIDKRHLDDIHSLVAFGKKILFTADDGQFGREPWSYTTLRPGDTNRDGVVDFVDFGALSANYGATGVGRERGDLNEDGVVDFSDFLLLSANYDVFTFVCCDAEL